jgi:predicted esterase
MIVDSDFYVFSGAKKSHSCVICLAGRSGCGGRLADHYQRATELHNTTFIGVTPYSRTGHIEWYPQPHSATEQSSAVNGLKAAHDYVEKIITSAMEEFEIPRNKIALTGFSAGAVMSLFATTHSSQDLAGVVVHSGACLETKKIPQCKNNTDILLTHGNKDYCFDWYERYVPMKNGLLQKGYGTFAMEDPDNTHTVSHDDMIISAKFLAPRLGYEGFRHSLEEKPFPLKMEVATTEKIPNNWKELSEQSWKNWR